MKKTLSIVLCLVMSLLFIGQAEGQKIKTIDGVKAVINGKKPAPSKGVPSKVKIKEDLVLGDSDDPDKSFSGLLTFAVDSDGKIYVLDIKEAKIKVFDSSGKFLKAFGKKGQGPGELGMPSGIQITPENELMIEDSTNRRLAFFTREGKFIRNISTAGRLGLIRLVVDQKGNLFGQEMSLVNNKMFFELKKFDRELKPLFTLDKVEFPLPIPGSGVKVNLMDMMMIYQFDSKGNLVYGRNKEYEFKVYNPEGKLILIIKKEHSPIKITEKDKEEILNRIPSAASGVSIKDMFEFPKYFPPYQNFVLDEQGRLFVRSWIKGKNEKDYVIHVFDSEGRFISQFTTGLDIRLIKDQKMYGIEENDLGYYLLKRYSLSWQ